MPVSLSCYLMRCDEMPPKLVCFALLCSRSVLPSTPHSPLLASTRSASCDPTGGKCVLDPTKSKKICQCRVGYAGRNCDMQFCGKGGRCSGNGVCTATTAAGIISKSKSSDARTWSCRCKKGFYGKHCQHEEMNCENGG